jgi:hypothetical protein
MAKILKISKTKSVGNSQENDSAKLYISPHYVPISIVFLKKGLFSFKVRLWFTSSSLLVGSQKLKSSTIEMHI